MFGIEWRRLRRNDNIYSDTKRVERGLESSLRGLLTIELKVIENDSSIEIGRRWKYDTEISSRWLSERELLNIVGILNTVDTLTS